MENVNSTGWVPPTTFYRFDSPHGIVAVRDVEADDIEEFVRYWHESGDEHLRYLHVDRDKLGTPNDTRARFQASMRTGDLNQQTIAFSVTLEGSIVAYFNLNRYSPLQNYPHVHVIDREHQAMGGATAGIGATTGMPYGLKVLFALFPIERIVLQTRTSNVAINRLLDYFLPVVETVQLENPDGLSGPGEFNHRYIYREDVPRLIERCDRFRDEVFGVGTVVVSENPTNEIP
jgi:RimJ/RimL family protein N-acetyltransferase